MSMQRGFTLVEALIVVAIMGILLAATVPAGKYWVENSKMASVEGNLDHAIGRAKSAALRNQHLAVGQAPVVALCLSDERTLSVLERTLTNTPDCENNVGTTLWSASIDNGVSVTSNGSDVSCVCLNNLGMVTTNSCGTCVSQPTISLAINDLNETVFLY